MNEFEDKYKDYLVEKEEIDYIGPHWIFGFENGYAATVIKDKLAKDLYEVGVMKLNKDGEYVICFDTPITDDVIEHIKKEAEVSDIIEQIKNLKGKEDKE